MPRSSLEDRHETLVFQKVLIRPFCNICKIVTQERAEPLERNI